MQEKPVSFWSPGVLVAAAIMLTIGWQLQRWALLPLRTFSDADLKLTFDYPSVWLPAPGSDEVLTQLLIIRTSDVRIKVSSIADGYEESVGILGIAFTRNAKNQVSYDGYEKLGGKDITVGGRFAYSLDFAFIVIPEVEGVPPKVMRVREVLIPRDDKLLVFSYSAPESVFREYEFMFNEILRSTRIG